MDEEALALVERLAQNLDDKHGFSTTSCQVYDTAWVAMVSREIANIHTWTFPQCFDYLMDSQASDGSWGRDVQSQTAGILDTAAALLALYKHATTPLQIQTYPREEVTARINLAKNSLKEQLAAWTDVASTNHIGIELIFPALLRYLEQEDESLQFNYPARSTLDNLHAAKFERFNVHQLYEKRPCTALHSLEAFIGTVDFDRVSHHLHNGSMLASPSSTAAYLVNASIWDEEAEGYLRQTLNAGVGCGSGGVPGTYPTHYFEISWSIVTLLAAGFDASIFDSVTLNKLVDTIKRGFKQDKGVIGFAPRAVDVDDTAKSLLMLKHLGQHHDVSPDVMIQLFEKDDAFATFGGERDRSISSNCHVLLALLQWNEPAKYTPQIEKATRFVCQAWWDHDGAFFRDKWHFSPLYPTMLMLEAFTALVEGTESQPEDHKLDQDLLDRVTICVFQAGSRILSSQQDDGSWWQCPEQTAYAVLSLAQLRQWLIFDHFGERILRSIQSAGRFLERNNSKVATKLWTSKTKYSVLHVAEAYCLAGRKICKTSQQTGSGHVGRSFCLENSIQRPDKFSGLLKSLPSFASMSLEAVLAALFEAALFVPLLQPRRLTVFPRNDMKMTKDKYLEMVPVPIIACNLVHHIYVPMAYTFDMMIFSVLVYQTDEFMESVAVPTFRDDLKSLHRIIKEVVAKSPLKRNGVEQNGVEQNGVEQNGVEQNGVEQDGRSSDTAKVKGRLQSLFDALLNHKHVTRASEADKQRMAHDFAKMLHAHVTRAEENAIFTSNLPDGTACNHEASQTLHAWVHASDDIAAPFGVSWTCSWISAQLLDGEEVFRSPKERYLCSAIQRHLGASCRIFNDIGSMARDEKEGNLNAIQFSELDRRSTSTLPEKRQALIELGTWEQDCMNNALNALEGARKPGTGENVEKLKRGLELLRYYCDLGKVYNEIYTLRDFSSSSTA